VTRLGTSLLTSLVAAAVVVAAGACSSDSGDAPEGDTVRVFAASSLTATFTELADEFEADHPDVEVELSFGGSADLVSQVQQGAPADVVATADTATMQRLTDDGLLEDPVDFATNRLEIAVPPDNPGRVASLQDLGRPGLAVVVCAPQVPCGAAAVEVARKAGVTLAPVSEEQSVTDVLGKVVSGEADAGLVYVTDVRAAGDDVTGVKLPASSQVRNTYPLGVVTDSAHPGLASDFVSLVTGDRGRSVLAAAGFGRP
jgi:molybdate transport system substrate-binding protein